MDCWLIRAGQQSRHAVRFATQDVVAIGWSDIDGLKDLRGLTKAEVLDRLHAAGRVSTAAAAADVEELITFRDRVSIGDIVVTSDALARENLIGCITGDYSFLGPSPVEDYHRIRSVEWYSRCRRDDLPEAMEKATRYRRTILPLIVNEDGWLAVG